MPHPLRLALVLALLAFPLLEIAVLIKAGSAFGFWPVFLVVVLTAFAGSGIVRQRGLSIFGRVMAQAEAGRSTLEPMLDGLLIVTAGVLLILPGLISDVLGAFLLLPPVRRFVIHAGLSRFLAGAVVQTDVYEGRFRTPGRNRPETGEPQTGPATIEGDYERLEERTVDPKGRVPNGRP